MVEFLGNVTTTNNPNISVLRLSLLKTCISQRENTVFPQDFQKGCISRKGQEQLYGSYSWLGNHESRLPFTIFF